MTVKGSERDPELTCNADGCNAWATDQSGKTKCVNCGGKSTGPKTEEGKKQSRMNATKHGLYALPEHLKDNFTEQQQDRYDAYFEALCTRYEHRLGEEPDAFAKDRLSRVAIECVKERIADEYFAKQAKDGNILVEDEIIGYDEESGQPQTVTQSNKLLKELTALKRETRLTLKDMGLLSDPESQKAQAQSDMGEKVARILQGDGGE